MIKMKGHKIAGLILVVGLMTITQVFAIDGVKILSKTKYVESGVVSSTNIYLTNNMVLLENRGARDNGAITFDAAKEEFRYIDHNKKEYYVFDKQTMKQLKDQIKMMVMMMQQFSNQMSEEQRKKFEKMMNPNGGPAMEFKKANNSEKVNRWKTTRYEGYTEGSKVTEMYIASFDAVGIKKERFEVMQKMVTYFKENLSEITALLPAGGSLSQVGFDESSPVFKTGIPVKTISYKQGKPENENIVERISAGNISDDVFAVPSGYQLKVINMQGQFGR